MLKKATVSVANSLKPVLGRAQSFQMKISIHGRLSPFVLFPYYFVGYRFIEGASLQNKLPAIGPKW